MCYLCVIICCVEIVTSSAVCINHLLSTAMAMLSNKWKASYDSKRKYGSKHLYGSKRLLMDRRQLIVNCTTATFYQKLTIPQIMKNRRNTSGELHYKARRNVRKTPDQDMFLKVREFVLKPSALLIHTNVTCHV